MDTFRQYRTKRAGNNRTNHLVWKTSDWQKRASLSEDETPDAMPPEVRERPVDHSPHPDEIAAAHEHRKTFTPAHISAMSKYKNVSGDVNDGLRGKGKVDPEVIKRMDHVTSQKTVKPMHAYRGFDNSVDVANMKPGDVYHDHGYTSTSLHHSQAAEFAGEYHQDTPWRYRHVKTIAKIHIPAGTKGHFLDLPDHPATVSPHHVEHEFVLHRGTSYRVSHHTIHPSKDTVGPGTHVVHMQVVKQAD